MNARIPLPLSLVLGLAISICFSSQPAEAERDWKYHSMWCASDVMSSTGQVVERLLAHTEARQRYCNSCSRGQTQFDAVLACYKDGKAESDKVREMITAAGPEKVNEFMAGKIPDCCKSED